jgi:hypothetical protein
LSRKTVSLTGALYVGIALSESQAETRP